MFSASKTSKPSSANWIDDVFSTYLYTGNNSTQTIANGIDLSTKGGLTWVKARNVAGESNWLFDTVRGPGYGLRSDTTNGQANNQSVYNQTFLTNGFSFNSVYPEINASGNTYASWTFRKQPKFFDVVTWTGNGVQGRQISHSLGSAPGFIIVKRTDAGSSNWPTYHRSLGASYTTLLNLTDPAYNTRDDWVNSGGTPTAPTSSVFYVSGGYDVNANGGTYVAYLFAHDAGGFGTAGTDNVISCGSFTTDANGQATVSLGYEPQWVLVKNTAVSSSGTAVSWNITDNMRGMPVGGVDPRLFANTAGAESTTYDWVSPTATGFVITPNVSSGDTYANSNYIYIAIRRPMNPPTTGTSVFTPYEYYGSGPFSNNLSVTTYPVDAYLTAYENSGTVDGNWFSDRLRGTKGSNTTTTSAETTVDVSFAQMNGVTFSNVNNTPGNYDTSKYVMYLLKRASTFFDEVCYTGTGSATTQAHNLGAVPEMLIAKRRNSVNSWYVYYKQDSTTYKKIYLEQTSAASNLSSGDFNNTLPTSTVVSLGSTGVNVSSNTYVMYLFATLPGISKVGSYTGTGTVTQTINCGFGAGGARFALIKRTDSTGDWYVFDSASGFTSSDSPYKKINTTNTRTTGNNGCYADNTGFTLTTNASATVNVDGGSYIYLAIA